MTLLLFLLVCSKKAYRKDALDELDTHQIFELKVYSHRVTRIKLAFNAKADFYIHKANEIYRD